jgi:hypothetical protein
MLDDMSLRGYSKTSFSNQILHIANPHDKLSTFMMYPSLGFQSLPTYPLGSKTRTSLSLSLSLVICRKEENMSFDDLSLLLGVTEIQVLLHTLVHGL